MIGFIDCKVGARIISIAEKQTERVGMTTETVHMRYSLNSVKRLLGGIRGVSTIAYVGIAV